MKVGRRGVAACRAVAGQGTSGMLRILSNPMNRLWIPTGAAAALACASWLATGCQMQPDVAMAVTTADGQKIEVPFNTAPAPVTDGVVTVDSIQFAPWEVNADKKARTVAYSFLIQFARGAVPAKILIEDDTEAPILKIFEDDHPSLVRVNFWAGVSRPFAPSDEHVNWILNLDNNVRVYRVTVTLKDGTTHILLKPVLIPAGMKSYIQKHLDMT
jgi:hypothetical protein